MSVLKCSCCYISFSFLNLILFLYSSFSPPPNSFSLSSVSSCAVNCYCYCLFSPSFVLYKCPRFLIFFSTAHFLSFLYIHLFPFPPSTSSSKPLTTMLHLMSIPIEENPPLNGHPDRLRCATLWLATLPKLNIN